jgi:hypothetical protein
LMSFVGSAAAAGSASEANTSKAAIEVDFIARTPWKVPCFVVRWATTAQAASGSGKLLTGVGEGWEGPRPDLSQGRPLISL